MSTISKIFTLNKHDDLPHVFNLSYEVHNFEHKEIMAQIVRKNPNAKYRVFTDNSAFAIERKYNASFD